MKLLVLQLLLVVTMARSFTICSGVSEEDEEFVVDLSQQVLACSRFLSCLLERFCGINAKIVREDGSSILGKLKISSRNSRRARRQVVKACCMQPCTINDLLQYCPSDSRHENVTEEDT